MKKTWKQWIAIACVLSMIACMLPAMTLAEDGVATPTDLAPITEEPAGEDPAEEPGEEPAEEIPGPGIPVLQFGNPGYKGTLKAGVDFTIVLHSDRYANILVTLTLNPKNGQAADTEGVKVLFNEKARKLVRAEKEDADSIDLQFEAYIAQDTDYTFVITSPFDADFVLTAGNRTAAAAEQENGEEEPAEEPEEEEPTEGETEEEPTEEEPEEEAPAEEKPEEKEPTENEPEKTENAEDESKDGDEDNNPKEPDEITVTEIDDEEVNTIRAWISTDDDQSGETITLKANAEPELEGVPTWYVRNEQVEEGAWKKAGYGEHMTFETTKGNEFRFILPDGTVSEVFKLKASEEAIEEESSENLEEETEEQPLDETEEETEAAEETQPDENPEELTEEVQEENTEELTEEEAPEEENAEELTEEENQETEEAGEQEPEETETEETAEEKPAETDTEETAAEEEETSEQEEETTEPEEETTEEAEVLPPAEELLALGYYGTQVVMSNGADIFDSLEEDAEPIGHLEAGEALWIRPTENEGWAEIYRADEEIPARYIRWDDVIINQKPETEEEEELLPDPEELLALGYYGTQIVMSGGADIFKSMDEDAEPVEHLEAGTELWIRPTENEEWAEIYRADEETPARYIRWDDVLINQKPETEEEELPARSIEISTTLYNMRVIPLGTEITMTAELINFQDDDICSFQWQYQAEGSDTFIDIEGANEAVYTYYIDKENFYYEWRLAVLVTKTE